MDGIELVVVSELNCCVCAVRFGMAEVLMEQRRKDGHTFWCPNGHGQHYKLPKKPRDEEIDDLRERVASLQDDLRESNEELAATRAHADQVEEARRPLLRRRRRQL